MNDQAKTKQQLIDELQILRAQIQSDAPLAIDPKTQLHQEATNYVQLQAMNLRISHSVQQMIGKEDLHNVLQTCLIEIQKTNPDVCCLSLHRIVDRSNNIVETFRVDKTGGLLNSPTQDVRPLVVQRWENLEIQEINDLTKWSEAKLSHFRKRINNHPVHCLLDLPFQEGTLVIQSTQKGPFSKKDHLIFQNIIDTLSLGMTRLEDILYLQDHNRKQNALLHINRTIQSMTQSEDLEQVLQAIYTQLQQAHIRFTTLSIHQVLKEETHQTKVYRILSAQKFLTGTYTSHDTIEEWKKGEIVYHPNTEKSIHSSQENEWELNFQNQGIPIRTILNVPFTQGILTLQSEQISAFSQQDIRFVTQITETLSIGIARANDLAQKEAQFKEIENIYRYSPIGLFVIDRNFKLLRFNEKLAETNGLTENDIGKTLYDIIPEQIKEREQQFKRVFEKGEPALNLQLQGYTPKDPHASKTWLANYYPLQSEKGETTRILGAVVDITDLKKAEQALQESEEQHRHVLENALDGVISINEKSEIIRWNHQAEMIFGWSFEEIKGKKVTETIIPLNDQAPHLKGLDLFLTKGESALLNQRTETVALHKEGHTFPVELSIVPLQLEDGYIFTGFVRDLSERQQIEAERQRTQRLRAMGEMAAGISHNLNNILTGVLGPAQMLQLTPQSAENRDEIDTILTAGLRARDIVSRLNKGWRTDTEILEATDINQAIGEAIQAARPRWKDEPESRGFNIDIRQHLSDVPPIQGTSSGLYDILINILFNAVDAMPKGGLISFATHKTKKQVRLLISDTGTGIPKETLERIFDPFFTTKETVGTGLGLSTVYGTINRWGGKIDVTSTPNKGTTFILDFKIWESEIPAPFVPLTQTQSHQVGRILLVDDDEMVTHVLKRVLSAHQISVFSSSPKALKSFTPNTYDILITDLGLPHLPGDQLAQKLCQKDPTLIPILISGWELLPNDPRRAHFPYFIQKPFHDFETFQHIIAQCLEMRNANKT